MSKIQKNMSWVALSAVFTFIALYFLFSVTWAGSIGGLIFASVLSSITLVLGLITVAIQDQRNKAAFADKQKTGDDMAVHQTRSIEIDLPFDLAFTIAQEALESLDGDDIPKTLTGIPGKQTLKIHKSDSQIGRIEAGLRAKTFGIQDFTDFSRINIQLQRLDSNSTRLQIESHPTSLLEHYDLGRHTHYVNHLALYMRKASREQSAQNHLSDYADDAGYDEDVNDQSQKLSDHE